MRVVKPKRRIRPEPKFTGLPRRNSTLSRWGNSLGVRIPQEAAARLNLKAGQQVTVEVCAGALTIRPTRQRKKWTEAELLKDVTPEMVAGAIDWGQPVGREVW